MIIWIAIVYFLEIGWARGWHWTAGRSAGSESTASRQPASPASHDVRYERCPHQTPRLQSWQPPTPAVAAAAAGAPRLHRCRFTAGAAIDLIRSSSSGMLASRLIDRSAGRPFGCRRSLLPAAWRSPGVQLQRRTVHATACAQYLSRAFTSSGLSPAPPKSRQDNGVRTDGDREEGIRSSWIGWALLVPCRGKR